MPAHLGKEVDFLLSHGMTYWGIERKSSTNVSLKDCRGLIDMIDAIRPNAKGIVLYAGEEVVPFSENIIAVPFRVLI